MSNEFNQILSNLLNTDNEFRTKAEVFIIHIIIFTYF
jgi:hypothetical protein